MTRPEFSFSGDPGTKPTGRHQEIPGMSPSRERVATHTRRGRRESPPEIPPRANARPHVAVGDEERPDAHAVVLARRRRRRARLRRQTPRRHVRRRASLRGDVAVPARRAAPRSVDDDATEFQPDEDVHEL